MARKATKNGKPIGIRGFARVHLQDYDGKISGDSGWVENQVTLAGFDYYLASLLGNTTSSRQLGAVALGTGTVPASDATALPGEITSTNNATAVKRTTFTVSVSGSKTLRLTATFASGGSHNYQAETIQNIGLFDVTSSTALLFAGVTYATSQWNTNQNVNVNDGGEKEQSFFAILSNSGKPSLFKYGNPELTAYVRECVETKWQEPLVGCDIVQTPNVIN